MNNRPVLGSIPSHAAIAKHEVEFHSEIILNAAKPTYKGIPAVIQIRRAPDTQVSFGMQEVESTCVWQILT